jgi:transposase-like protein
MSNEPKPPTTLLEAVRYFQDLDVANEFVAALRWPDGPECPSCGGKEHSFLSTRRLWKCKACKRQFSVKVGTIFEDSPIPLDKWLASIWLIANAKNGISSHELGRSIGLTQKSAWFVLHRIRLAMQTRSFEMFSGEVEVDETFIGGKARFMHKNKRPRVPSPLDKTAVLGILERGGEVRAVAVPHVGRKALRPHIRRQVKAGSQIYTDEHRAYDDLFSEYSHEVINHAERYVDGQVHTNGLENFWSLLKRGLKGTYISVEPFHLFRYLDEQVFRFNKRQITDLGRFVVVLGVIGGRRLTYRALTGKG